MVQRRVVVAWCFCSVIERCSRSVPPLTQPTSKFVRFLSFSVAKCFFLLRVCHMGWNRLQDANSQFPQAGQPVLWDRACCNAVWRAFLVCSIGKDKLVEGLWLSPYPAEQCVSITPPAARLLGETRAQKYRSGCVRPNDRLLYLVSCSNQCPQADGWENLCEG